jgi:hypothetical protein
MLILKWLFTFFKRAVPLATQQLTKWQVDQTTLRLNDAAPENKQLSYRWHQISLGLFQHEPPTDAQLLRRVVNPSQASFDEVPPHWRTLSGFRPHSYSDSDLKETRLRQERKKMLRRKDSTNSYIPPPSSRSLPASPLMGTDQRRSASDLVSRSGGVANPATDNAEMPLFDSQVATADGNMSSLLTLPAK